MQSNDLAHEAPLRAIPSGAGRQRTLRINLGVSSFLMRNHKSKNAVTPENVIDVLNDARVRFLLAGAHSISAWANEPRYTQDVDVLVAARHIKVATRALSQAFPRLTIDDTPVVVRFTDPTSKIVVIDVMKPNQPLFRVAHRHAYQISTPRRKYFVPSLEFALAMKFAAMVSPNRRESRKLMDSADFINIVQASEEIDLVVLNKLGNLVYADGGKEVISLVARVRAGKRLRI